MWPGFDSLRELSLKVVYSAFFSGNPVSPSHQRPNFDLIGRVSGFFVVLSFNRWLKDQGTFYALLACFASLYVSNV